VFDGVGSALGGPVIAVDFATVEPYTGPRLLAAIRTGRYEWGYYAVYEELLAMPTAQVALPYCRAAAESKDPLLRSVGLAKLARTDSPHADRYLERALDDPHEVVRCEAIATLVALKGRKAVSRLQPLSRWSTELERCEAAAALVRLGNREATSQLQETEAKLEKSMPHGWTAGWDYDAWLPKRAAYYTLVLESARRVPETRQTADIQGDLAAFAGLIPFLGGPFGYLRPILQKRLEYPDPDVRAQALRCLGHIPDAWATKLLRTRLHDESVCALNGPGYGWSSTVGCLAAVCLLERGDRSGLRLLRRLSSTDHPAAVALARAGERGAARDLVPVVARQGRDPDTWDSSPAWWAYHLARLGDTVGIEELRWQLRVHPKDRHRAEVVNTAAAACILALANDRGRPMIYAPARGVDGPVFYPDCWRP
jgi:HEAT repeat protein